MKCVIQRVKEASVSISGAVKGKIGNGLLLFIGFTHSDTKEMVPKLIQKCLKLRLFNDSAGKMNLSVQDIVGEVLVISQFTLYADCKKGRRPSFVDAMSPDKARELYTHFLDILKESYPTVESGEFGADMKVSLINDGPVTIVLEE